MGSIPRHSLIPSETIASEDIADRLSYFVATLDYARCVNAISPHGITTINQLLDERAASDPNLPVIGMPVPGGGSEKWGSLIYRFRDLFNVSNRLAHQLVRDGIVPVPSKEGPLPTAAILAQSSAQLLMTFLALMRIGYSVLLIAPQCTQHTISHLLKATQSTHIFYSQSLTDLATSSKSTSCECQILPEIPQPTAVEPYPTPSNVTGETIAYIHHTSGTSTGLPEPIPHSHAAATSNLPHLPSSLPVAAFSTTPLYHGGTADMMRSLMSSSMLWLYPPSVPVTSGNILQSLRVADRAKLPVRLFTAVPYVLEVCMGDEEVLRRMAEMDMVGVGGAPLGMDVGVKLVGRGVKLVSRFGSSECGFLMSSYRDFITDQNWEYLRISHECAELYFERQSDSSEKSELIVLPGWPQIVKPNRPDGSYATGDLFTPHPIIKGAYKYQGRNDSTIVLSNGKKLDPTIIEEAFRESDLVREAIVFGNNRAFLGVLLFPTPKAHGQSRAMVKELVGRVNERVHWKIMEEMVVICTRVKPPKTSKGTVMRSSVDEMFQESIDGAYKNFECHGAGGKIETADVEGVRKFVYSLIMDVTGKEDIEEDTDLFAAGVDSVMAAQIRNRLVKGLEIGKALPPNVIFEQRTIGGLVRFIAAGRETMEDLEARQMDLMLRLVEKYGDFGDSEGRIGTDTHGGSHEHVVVVLGAHILHQLCNIRKDIKKVICLCRANNHDHALVRVEESLRIRKLPFHKGNKVNVVAYAAELGKPDLGLGNAIHRHLEGEVTKIIHAAWAVNFVASLESFERDHIAGIQNLLNLALRTSHQPLLYFCSSTAAALGDIEPRETIKEKLTADPRTAAPLGYGRSKWVAEKICQKLRGRARVLRLGQLCADTINGVWNETEAWPLMFASINVVGCLPELSEKLSWLPVDIAAKTVLDIALDDRLHNSPEDLVFHIVNTNTSTTWSEILDWIQQLGDVSFDRVAPSQWVKKLADTEYLSPTNPSLKLLSLWEANYGEGFVRKPGNEGGFSFEVRNTSTFSNGEGWKIDEEYIQRIWENWVRSGFVGAQVLSYCDESRDFIRVVS